jgi:hypothetical protein
MSPRALVATAVLLLALATPSGAFAGRGVAALQVTLQARGLYAGTIDGIRGPGTVRAIRRFQRRHGLVVDGVVGAQTRRALGRYARHRFGSRLLRRGKSGWDVAALQFALATHGFPCGTFDGGFGPRTTVALRRFQRRSHLIRDGVAGPATYAALNRPRPRAPYALSRPVQAPLGDSFGPRGARRLAFGRLWLPRAARPPGARAQPVRTPLPHQRPPWSAGFGGHADRESGLLGRLYGPPPPFRGAGPRSGRESATRLALARGSAASPPGSR